MVVIVAGYENEMHRFIESNPGLRSRFSKTIHFSSYSDEELLEIFQSFCEKNKYILDGLAKEEARRYFHEHCGDETFGNARGVRNYFEMVITNQATRLIDAEADLDNNLSNSYRLRLQEGISLLATFQAKTASLVLIEDCI